MRFATPIRDIKGVGPKTQELLSSAGLKEIQDLIYFLPRTYDDYSEISHIDAISPGNVVLKGTISAITSRRVRRGLSITEAVLSDDSGRVPLVWFNQPYRAAQLKNSKKWLVAGEFAFSQRRYQILNPSVQASDDEQVVDQDRIVPIYRQVAGLKTQLLQKVITEIRPIITMLPETLPDMLVRHEQLIPHAKRSEEHTSELQSH